MIKLFDEEKRAIARLRLNPDFKALITVLEREEIAQAKSLKDLESERQLAVAQGRARELADILDICQR